MAYTSAYTGAQIDSGIERALNPDNLAVSGSTRPYQSGAAYTKFASVDSNITSLQSAVTTLQGLETLLGATAPTTSTVGAEGQLYFDAVAAHLYVCTLATSSSYTWVQVTA